MAEEWEGDYFLTHKFIKRLFECWATSTKQLLNAGGGHQAPLKAAHSLWKEVGQNEQKERQKSWGWRFILRRESWRRSFQTSGNPLISRSVGSFGISEGNITGKENKKQKQNMCLTTTPSREVAQMLTSASTRELDKEVRVAFLG